MPCADQSPKQSVLIHSACGGVGIAAIQICRMVGAEIYATVGNEEKVQYLTETFGITRDRIFDSRSISFRSGVMQATGGRGVDVVLNSLSGELLHASWKCVAEFGSMVELGKRDFIGQGRLEMDIFEDNRSFFGVHLAPLCEKKPRAVQRLLARVAQYYEQGHIQPIRPTRFFDAVDVEEAFRVMQKGQHIGKFVVRMPEDPSVLETARSRRGFQLPADGSYLLVGGLGGLGRSLSTWLVEHGAKNLVYLSRSGGTKPEDIDLVAELAAAGCEAQIIQGSVTNLADVERAIALAHLPVRGVIQSSMVLRDKLFPDTTYDDWAAVTAPKVAGTWNLHTALARAGRAVDFFVLFSSVSGLIGSYGQASYAAANTFLDSFVQYRHARGLPASVIDIGVMGGVGHVSTSQFLQDQFRAASAYMLGERELLDTLELAMRQDVSLPRQQTDNHHDEDTYVCLAQLGIGLRSTRPIDSPANRIPWRRDPRMARYRNIEETTLDDSADAPGTKPGDPTAADPVRAFRLSVSSSPRSLADPSRVAELAQLVGTTLFGFMMRPLEDLDVSAPMSGGGVGMDSLVAVELRNWCRQRLGLDVTVLEIVNAPSILALAGHMAEAWMVKAGVATREGGRFEMVPVE
jgi:NAD(P)-dependent dehydrogenase (short-subunit alcohol dehydrogenase family)